MTRAAPFLALTFVAVGALSLALTVAVTTSARAQVATSPDAQTLADIRQQLTVLYVDIQNLRRELSTTGAPEGQLAGGTTLGRLDAIEEQLRSLTGRTEKLEYRIERIVQDGTNRIGDLEFRLVELEGGDVSQLGETTTLGGDVSGTHGGSATGGEIVPPVTGTTNGGSELAVGESSDFERASTSLAESDFRSAVDQFTAFTVTYPGSPLEAEAHLRRGQALEGLEENTDAARAFLESYSRDPQGAMAAESLFFLGRSLSRIDQPDEACVTLNEVGVRYPDSPWVLQAQSEMQALECQ